MAMPLEELSKVDAAIFGDSLVLSNAEVGVMLDRYVLQRSQDNTTWTPSKVVEQTQAYVTQANPIRNEESLKALRGIFEEAGILPYEFGVLANTMPETSEEAFALLPSLKERYTSDRMDAILTDASVYYSFH